MPSSDTYCFFLLKCIKECDSEYGSLFNSDPDDSKQNEGNRTTDIRREFYEYWGWIATIDEVTYGQPWLEDEVYEWEYKRLLNRLAYMKDKGQMEEAIARMKMIDNAGK